MSGPTALLAEDELPLRDQLAHLLERVWPELRIVALAEDGIDAMRLLQQVRPDVAFLDIQMPGVTGLEVARHAAAHTLLVFVTAYQEHAVTAFEREAVDYLLKPISAARLFEAVGRLKRRLQTDAGPLPAVPTAAPGPAARGLRWITAADGEELRLITIDDIVYLEADNKVIRVVTTDGQVMLRRALKDLAAELDADQFWQVHRAVIVNTSFVTGLTRDFRGKLRLRLRGRAETLPVSDSYAERFR